MDPRLSSALQNKETTRPTPEEISSKEFKRVLWGYAPEEVLTHLQQLAKNWEKALKTEKEQAEKIQAMSEEITRWRGREAELTRLKEKLAQETEEIRAKAAQQAAEALAETEKRAAEIRQRTEDWLETVLAQVEETERQRHNFVTAFRSALDSHYALLKDEEKQSEPLSARLSEALRGGQSLNS